jgi:ribosome biogenesis GTPase / thiamine phosphate phosphatase
MPAAMEAGARSATLVRLGWTLELEAAFEPHAASGLVPGRVTSVSATAQAGTDIGVVEVVVQRRFRRTATSSADYPVVGDWLALEPLHEVRGAPSRSAALRAVLPRASVIARAAGTADRSSGHVGAQVLAANVDSALLVSAVGRDLNPRRIERYLLMCLAGGVRPVVVLNKSDLAIDLAGDLETVGRVARGHPVLALSARTGDGLDALGEHLRAGVTVCLLGSSGVGKSTIGNALLGSERQAVREARADDERGRHTTTMRELFELPSGALLIDTPGLRAVGVWDDGAGLGRTYDDIEGLAAKCRFSDCRHTGEPGCNVTAAVAAGQLDADRLEGMRKLDREIHALELRSDVRASRAVARRMGRIYREAAKPAKRRWIDG